VLRVKQPVPLILTKRTIEAPKIGRLSKALYPEPRRKFCDFAIPRKLLEWSIDLEASVTHSQPPFLPVIRDTSCPLDREALRRISCFIAPRGSCDVTTPDRASATER
jgi:hypothetical protein